jgi:hypothetical protein
MIAFTHCYSLLLSCDPNERNVGVALLTTELETLSRALTPAIDASQWYGLAQTILSSISSYYKTHQEKDCFSHRKDQDLAKLTCLIGHLGTVLELGSDWKDQLDICQQGFGMIYKPTKTKKPPFEPGEHS